MAEFISEQIFDAYTEITFSSPGGNSLPSQALQELVNAIDNANSHPGCAILLRSGGDRTFCAGANFDELLQIDNHEAGLAFFSGFGRVINAMRNSKKIIITRVQGKAVGGGVGVIAGSDFTIATKYSSVRLSELAIGIGPFVIGPAVERKVGNAAFRKMALTPEEWQTAEWAKNNGLYEEVFDDIKQVDDYILHLIGKWTLYSRSALETMKKVIWDGTSHWDDLLIERAKISGSLILSEEAKQILSTIKNKA